MAKTFSLSFNEKRSAWIGTVRAPDGSWKTKQLPKVGSPYHPGFARHQEIDAEHFLLDWASRYAATYGRGLIPSHVVKPEPKTLTTLVPKWLALRKGNSSATYAAKLAENARIWLLPSERPHFPIHAIELEKIRPEEITQWIASLPGKPSTVLAYVDCLSTFFRDAVGYEWLNMVNPFQKLVIRDVIKQIAEKHVAPPVLWLSQENANTLLTGANPRIPDWRRLRYLLALTTGARDKEMLGWVWSDFDGSTLAIDRQLSKIGKAPIVSFEQPRNGSAECRPPKARSFRVLPLHPLALAALTWWRETGWKQWVGRSPGHADPIFPRENPWRVGASSTLIAEGHQPGDFVFPESASLLRQDLNALELPTEYQAGHPFTFKSLRSTFATLLEAQGLTDAQVGALCGHGAKNMTRAHYLGTNLERNRELVGRLPFRSVLLGSKLISID